MANHEKLRAMLFGLVLSSCESTSNVAPPVAKTNAPVREPVRAFTCDTRSVAKPTLIANVRGAPGQALVVRPTRGACQYDLGFRASDGLETIISNRPGMTFLAAALAVPTSADPARIVACFSDVQHRPTAARRAPRQVPADRVRRTIESVDVVCRIRESGRWQPPLVVVSSSKERAAAWLDALDTDPSEPGAFSVRWTLASSFTYLGGQARGHTEKDGSHMAIIRPALRGNRPRVGPFDDDATNDWEVEVAVD